MLSFTATLVERRKGISLQIPFDPEQRWGIAIQPLGAGRRGFRVIAKLDIYQFESVIVPRSRRFWMLVAPEVIEKLGLAVGDNVRISVKPLQGRDMRIER